MSFAIRRQKLTSCCQYRELRDNGKFTPTRMSFVHWAAVSVNGDDEQGDTIGANAGLGTADAGADDPSTEHPNAPNAPVVMDEALLQLVLGGTGKRRCVGAHMEPPSVEAVSSGRWHCCVDQCRSLISVLNERGTSEHL